MLRTSSSRNSHCASASGTSTTHGCQGSRAGSRSVSERASGSRVRGLVLAVPRNRSLKALPQRRPRLEAEELARARPVDASPRLAVRLRLVPLDPPAEPRDVGDELGELANGD